MACCVKEPKRLTVIKGTAPKNTEATLQPVVCGRCKKHRGVAHGELLEIRTGGYWKKGRMVGFRKAIICAHCFVKDKVVETIGYLN